MKKRHSLFIRDKRGNYDFTRKVTEEDILALAQNIVRSRIRRGDALLSPKKARRFLSLHLGTLEHEEFYCIFIDNKHRVICYERLFRGTLNHAAVYPREVAKRALHHNAAGVIFVHNHPSGIAEPSQADRNLTAQLKNALSLIEVRTLDHFVIGGNTLVSFAERGML